MGDIIDRTAKDRYRKSEKVKKMLIERNQRRKYDRKFMHRVLKSS